MTAHLKTTILPILAVVFFLLPNNLLAHEPDHTYLYLRVYENSIEGRFEITIADINRELGLNLNEEVVQAEIDPVIPQIQALLLSNASFGANSANFPLQFTDVEALALDDEADYVKFNFQLNQLSELPDNLDITYSAFFDKNPDHKGMLIIEHNWKAGIIDNYSLVAEIFTEDETSKTLSLTDASILNGVWAMIKLGMWHIWIGLDHILFLVALILPSVLRRRTDAEDGDNAYSTFWNPVDKFKPAFLYILKIVTFFTIAHSITLAIASLGVMDLPSRYVESIIAISIALAALHNIRPVFRSKEWVIAFIFGLFHGFGFASVLGEKGLGGEYLVLSLLGFNVGVEFGQVLIIAGIFPVLFLIRNLKLYPKLLTYGSVLLILISLNWTVERLFDFNIPIGRWVGSLLAIM